MPNAKNIESKELMIRPEKYLNKNETYYLYCQHGITSQKLCQILRNNGYNAISINGGYEAWLLQNQHIDNILRTVTPINWKNMGK